MSRLAASKLWLLLPQSPLFRKDGGIKQISKISSSRQKSFSHRKEALNVWPSMPKLQHKDSLKKELSNNNPAKKSPNTQ
jgi:hypothetical protein